MYLFDTNIFLEILLSQEKSNDCKKALNNKNGDIFISDFSLHSIGVILFRKNKEIIFNKFLSDLVNNINIISLSISSYKDLYKIKEIYKLDFDDAYQSKIAEDENFTIITIDKDFERIKDRVKIEFI